MKSPLRLTTIALVFTSARCSPISPVPIPKQAKHSPARLLRARPASSIGSSSLLQRRRKALEGDYSCCVKNTNYVFTYDAGAGGPAGSSAGCPQSFAPDNLIGTCFSSTGDYRFGGSYSSLNVGANCPLTCGICPLDLTRDAPGDYGSLSDNPAYKDPIDGTDCAKWRAWGLNETAQPGQDRGCMYWDNYGQLTGTTSDLNDPATWVGGPFMTNNQLFQLHVSCALTCAMLEDKYDITDPMTYLVGNVFYDVPCGEIAEDDLQFYYDFDGNKCNSSTEVEFFSAWDDPFEIYYPVDSNGNVIPSPDDPTKPVELSCVDFTYAALGNRTLWSIDVPYAGSRPLTIAEKGAIARSCQISVGVGCWGPGDATAPPTNAPTNNTGDPSTAGESSSNVVALAWVAGVLGLAVVLLLVLNKRGRKRRRQEQQREDRQDRRRTAEPYVDNDYY